MIYELELYNKVSCIIESKKDNIAVCNEFKELFDIVKPLYDKGYERIKLRPHIWITKSCGPVLVTFKLNNKSE